MKKYNYQIVVTDEIFEASIELASYLKTNLDFRIITYKDDPRYVGLLQYSLPNYQKMEFRRGGIKITFDYINIYIRYGTKLIWSGIRINQYFLVQLHYLGGLSNYEKKKFMIDLNRSGMNQSHQDYLQDGLA